MEVAEKVMLVYKQFALRSLSHGPNSKHDDSDVLIKKLPYLEAEEVHQLILHVIKLMSVEPALLKLDGRCFIAGDIHGSISDLLRIIRYGGLPSPERKYLFLGDYVDRGEFSVEVIIFLITLKIIYPRYVFLLRGNHEFVNINSMYGFKDQVFRMYAKETFELFNIFFAHLPLAAVIGNHTFCVHGGISDCFKDIGIIASIPKPSIDYSQTIYSSLVMDLVWSDPSTDYPMFGPQNRGEGHYFGEKALHEFLKFNKLKRVIRAHQAVQGGVEQFAKNLYTVFSSSNNYNDNVMKSGLIDISADGNLTAYAFPLVNMITRREAKFIPVSIVPVIKKKSPLIGTNAVDDIPCTKSTSSLHFIKGAQAIIGAGANGGSITKISKGCGSKGVKAQLMASRKSSFDS